MRRGGEGGGGEGGEGRELREEGKVGELVRRRKGRCEERDQLELDKSAGSCMHARNGNTGLLKIDNFIHEL